MSISNLKPPPAGWTYEIPKRGQIMLRAGCTPSGLFCSPYRCIFVDGGEYVSVDPILAAPIAEIEDAVANGADLAALRARFPYFVSNGAAAYGKALFAPVTPEPPPIPDEWLTPVNRKRKG